MTTVQKPRAPKPQRRLCQGFDLYARVLHGLARYFLGGGYEHRWPLLRLLAAAQADRNEYIRRMQERV